MDFSISNIQKLLRDYKIRFLELSDLLCYPEVLADKKIYNAYIKEYNQIKPFMECLENIEIILREKEHATNEALIIALNEAYMKEINKVRSMIQKESFDEYQGAEIEVISFDKSLSNETVQCISLVCSNKGLKTSIKNNSIIIYGTNQYSSFLRYNGSYEIGRTKVTICVYPYVDNIDDVDLSNIKIDFYRSSGAGGQNVNKVETAVRIYDYLTGIVVTCQDERSQQQNREKALIKLKEKIIELKNKEFDKIVSYQKKNAKEVFLGRYNSIEQIFS